MEKLAHSSTNFTLVPIHNKSYLIMMLIYMDYIGKAT